MITTEFQVALSLVATAGMVLILVGLSRAAKRQKAVASRLSLVLDGPEVAPILRRSPIPTVRAPRLRFPLAARIEERLLAGRLGRLVQRELASAGIKASTLRFFLLQLALGLLLAALMQLFTHHALMTAIGGLAGAYFPWWWVQSRQRTRREEFAFQMADTVSLLVSALRAGQSLSQSIERVARDSLEPTASEFRQVAQEVKLGLPVKTALRNLASRAPGHDVDLLVTALEVHSEVGGDIVPLMDAMADVMRVRYRLKAEIRVVTSQQRLAAQILLGLPLFIAVLLFLLNPSYMLQLFSPEPLLLGLPALVMPVAAGLLLLMGYFAIRKAADVEL